MGCTPSIPRSDVTEREWDNFCLPEGKFLEARLESKPNEVISNPDAYFQIREGDSPGHYWAIRIGGQAFAYRYDNGVLRARDHSHVWLMIRGTLTKGNSAPKQISNEPGGVYLQLGPCIKVRCKPCALVLPACPLRTAHDWDKIVGARFNSYHITGTRKAEWFDFKKEGSTYMTVGQWSGTNRYTLAHGVLMHTGNAEIYARLEETQPGQFVFVWSHGYYSSPESNPVLPTSSLRKGLNDHFLEQHHTKSYCFH